MAGEVSYNVGLSVFKLNVTTSAISRALQGTINALSDNNVFIGPTVIVVTTAGLAIPLGQVSSLSLGWFYNLDPVNYVQLFSDSTMTKCLCRLLPGGAPALIPLDPAAVPYAKAHTANCGMEYFIINT